MRFGRFAARQLSCLGAVLTLVGLLVLQPAFPAFPTAEQRPGNSGFAGGVFWKRSSEEWCDPSGAPDTGALIGKLAENSYEHFLIGSSCGFTAQAAGRLFLGINDDNTSDNRGSFEVEISRER